MSVPSDRSIILTLACLSFIGGIGFFMCTKCESDTCVAWCYDVTSAFFVFVFVLMLGFVYMAISSRCERQNNQGYSSLIVNISTSGNSTQINTGETQTYNPEREDIADIDPSTDEEDDNPEKQLLEV